MTPDSDGDGIPDFQDNIDGLNPDDTNGNGLNAATDLTGIGAIINLNDSSSSVTTVPTSVTSPPTTTGPVGNVQTGLSGLGAGGGGCTLSRDSTGAIDPLLALLALLSCTMMFLSRRRNRHIRGD